MNPYDIVPYDAASVPATRPEQLALLSWLNGGPRPPIEGYRVLELGCANGANLLPLACYRPDITAVGIDASAGQIEAARAAAEMIAADNIRFEQTDLRRFAERTDLAFDYIIAHGILSWVEQPVQDALLQLCANLLAPDGVAYVSFNAHPGWKMRGLLREMIAPELDDIGEITAGAERAQELARGYRALLSGELEHPYCQLLRHELGLLAGTPSSHVAHDYFEETNHPFYFYEFAERLERHGLVHVAEAEFDPSSRAWVAQVREALSEQGFAGIELEQYQDLLTYGQLRTSILCRSKDHPQPEPGPEVLLDDELAIGSRFAQVGERASLVPGVEATFEDDNDIQYEIRDPLLKAALFVLADDGAPSTPAPAVVSGAAALVRAEGGEVGQDDLNELRELLLFFARRGYLHLRLREPSPPPRTRPVARPLARVEGMRGRLLTTVRHTHLAIDDFDRYLLARLDGSIAPEALINELFESAQRGELTVEDKGEFIKDPGLLRETLSQSYQWLVSSLEGAGLLEQIT